MPAIDEVVIAHRKEVDALEEDMRTRLLEAYQTARVAIGEELDRLEAAGKGETFTAVHLRTTLAQMTDTLDVMRDAHHAAASANIAAGVELGAAQVVQEVAAVEAAVGDVAVAARVAGFAPVIPAETVGYIADPANLLLSEFRDGIFTDVSRSLGQSVIRGEGIDQATRRLRDTLNDEGPLKGAKDYELERIARTEVNNAVNVGHEQALKQVDTAFADLAMQKQWSSHFDGRTSDVCKELGKDGGQIRAVSEDFVADGWRGPHPPAHPNCRSRVIPYRAAWAAFERDRSKKGHGAFSAYRAAVSTHWGACGPACSHEEDHMLLKRNGKDGERKALVLSDFKMVDEEKGVFTGHAAAFNNVDSYGDVIEPGAFKKTLAAWQASGKMIPILWQHNPDEPIGVCDPADMEEDSHGLKVKARLIMGVQKADEARALMKAGALGGLSIGYDVFPGGKKAPPKGSNGKRHLTDLDLWEFSPVTFPANGKAGITEVKSAEGAKAADFATVLDLNQRRDALWSRKWEIAAALRNSNELAVDDANLTRDQKIAAITANLAQYSGAMISWFGDLLDLREKEVAAGLKASCAPAETKDGAPGGAKAGRTISAATQKQIDEAVADIESAAGKLKALVAAAPAQEAGSGDSTAEQKSSGAPTPTGSNDGQASKTATAEALDRMRAVDAIARMKAAM